MPGNSVVINNAIEYYVSDSQMDELTEWLHKKGLLLNNTESADTPE